MSDTAAKRIFRASALERLSSPERLDQLIPVIRPYDWIAFVVLATLIALGLVWSVVGEVPTRIKGSGILISTGGRVVDAVAAGEGTVQAVKVVAGATVAKGDVLVEIENPDLSQALASARAVAAERQAQQATLASQIGQNLAALDQSLVARRKLLEVRAADAEARAKTVEEELAKETELFERRLITWQKLNESRQALASARQIALEARSQITQAESDTVSQRNAADRELRAAVERTADARRRVDELTGQLRQRDTVVSSVAGRVTEVKVAVGARVQAGLPLVAVESGVTGIEVLLYLPPDRGKQARVGMEVRVAPSTVTKEEFGTLLGTLTEVSDFPSTPQAMLATLQNERLVAQLSPKGPPFMARVALRRDPATASGYAWTGGAGPATTLASGTLADAEVTVARRAPITFVLPWLKTILGTGG